MKNSVLFLGAFIFLIGCKKPPEEMDFDRGAMLSNLSASIIEPAYNSMNLSLDQLHEKATIFSSTPGLESLNELKASFNQAYLDFEACKMLNFGAMEDYGIVSAMNTYPTDSSKILANISSGTYTLGALENFQAIGLPAIDFLLYHTNELEVITEFSLATDAENRKNYLIDLCDKMQSEFELIQIAWTNTRTDFIAADGNDVGASSSILFNAFVKDIELVKNAKIGIPAGFQTAGEKLPQYVETYYSEQSITLAVANLNALKTLFNGKDGIGFDDYIKDVEGSDIESSLADRINTQFDLCVTKLEAIDSPFSESINNQEEKVNEAYTEIKALLTFIKTDMSSILGLLITFQDNDGD